MRAERRPGDPLYDFVEIDASELGRFPDGLRDIYERRIDGLIVRGVYDSSQMQAVAELLRRNDPPLPRIAMPWGETIGRVLVRSEREEYHAAATRFREDCRRLFEGLPDFETRLEEVTSALAGGRRVAIAEREGAPYTPATIRILGEGGDLALHCGNQFLQELPEFRHLQDLVQLEDQLSYFLTIAEPEQGGELTVFDLEWGQTPGSLVEGRPIREVIDRFERRAIRPRAGDLLFFDGGRIWHLVSAVRGARLRITLGGFAAFSRDDGSVLYWS
jgi:hypothetical protein